MCHPLRSRRHVLIGGPRSPGAKALTRLTAVVVLLGTALGAVDGTSGRSREASLPTATVAGQLLVATPDMQDPRFARTVIYMIRHDVSGAQGLVINRPLGDIPLAVLLEYASMPSESVKGTVRLHSGGPVEALRIFVLHTGEYAGDRTLTVRDGIALTWDPDILSAIARGKGPRRVLFALGYAGWGPGQLEAEMKAGAWVRASADEALLFDTDYDSKWDRATARRKIDI
jgi:putative transcriptional regulator